MSRLKLVISLVILQLCHTAVAAAYSVGNMMVEYAATPIGIDVERPRFCWQMLVADGERGQYQKAYNIPGSIVNLQNCYSKHSVSLSSVLGETVIRIDGNERPVGSLNINPLGRGGDFIAFPVVGDVGYSVEKNCKATFSDVRIVNYRSPSNTIVTVDTLREVSGGERGTRMVFTPRQNSSPMLRTAFDAGQKDISKARLYVTSRGIYDIYVNNKKVGDDYFNPGFTQFDKTLMYQTFDVTNLMNKGGNAVGAQLAEGWWSGGITYTGDNWNYFGDRQSLLAKLVITYADGDTKTIVTDPETWKYYNHGPVLYVSFFQGEVYDARREKEISGWDVWQDRKQLEYGSRQGDV